MTGSSKKRNILFQFRSSKFTLAGHEPLSFSLPNSPYCASDIHPERTRSAHGCASTHHIPHTRRSDTEKPCWGQKLAGRRVLIQPTYQAIFIIFMISCLIFFLWSPRSAFLGTYKRLRQYLVPEISS